MIYSRPLKNVLGKIIPFGKDEVIHHSNLGSGVANDTTFLRGDGTWVSISISSSLNDLTDVAITNPQVDQILVYNGTTWVNSSNAVVNAGPGVTLFMINTASGISSYETLSHTPDNGPEVNDTTIVNNNTILIHGYATDTDINKLQIDAGIWEFNYFSYVDHLHATFITEVYKRTSGGTETLLFSVESDPVTWTSVAIANSVSVQPQFSCNITDRLVFKIYAKTIHSSDVSLVLLHSGTEHYSHIHTPLVLNHNDIAGLQGGSSNQYYHLTNSEYSTYQSWIASGIPDSKIQSASTWNAKQNAITTGITSQYFRGDLSLATFPTNVSSFTNDSGYLTSASLSSYAPINSPTFTGVPLSTTPTVGDSSTKIATTAFVTTAVSNAVTTQITQANLLFLANNF